MNKRAPRPIPPEPHPAESVDVPTEAQARARLASFSSTVGRMTQTEFDALVAVAAPAEDAMAGQAPTPQ